VRKRLLKHRAMHLKDVNKKSMYKVVEIEEKNKKGGGELDGDNVFGPEEGEEIDLAVIFMF
jgi:hypothetical protein